MFTSGLIIICSHHNTAKKTESILRSHLSPSLFLSLSFNQSILFICFLSVSSFSSKIRLVEHPERRVIIFLHLVVITCCSVFLFYSAFLHSVMSVMADKTQQQTLIYTHKIVEQTCSFFQHYPGHSILFYSILFYSILSNPISNSHTLWTLFTPKSLSSSSLCSIKSD